MAVLSNNRFAIGGFRPDSGNGTPYWTGAEAGGNAASYQFIEWAWTGWTSKGIGGWVRCVRKD